MEAPTGDALSHVFYNLLLLKSTFRRFRDRRRPVFLLAGHKKDYVRRYR
jgi:hypothetical protein